VKPTRLLFLLFLSTFIFSCKKDDFSLNIAYPSSYQKSGIRINGNLRVFSLAGEITARSVLSRFNQSDSAYFSTLANDIGYGSGKMDSIRFLDAQHATVYNSDQPLECLMNAEGENMILSRTDTTRSGTYANELTHNIYYYIGQVKPDVYSEYLISSTRGEYIFGFTAREKFVLKKPESQLLAPLILYRLYPDGLNNYYYYRGEPNNMLQNDFYPKRCIFQNAT